MKSLIKEIQDDPAYYYPEWQGKKYIFLARNSNDPLRQWVGANGTHEAGHSSLENCLLFHSEKNDEHGKAHDEKSYEKNPEMNENIDLNERISKRLIKKWDRQLNREIKGKEPKTDKARVKRVWGQPKKIK